MTVLDLIKSSLRLISAIASGETPDAAMTDDARVSLNTLLNSWQNEGLLSLLEEQSFAVVAGTASYVIGDTQAWDGNKPLKILNANLTDSVGNTYSLKQISYLDYTDAFDKTYRSIPCEFAYLPGADTGAVYLYPTPVSNYTIKIVSQKAFTEYETADLSSDIVLPSGYLSALKYNLAVELMPEYGIDVNPMVVEKARETLVPIKRTNRKKARLLKYEAFTRGSGIDLSDLVE